MQYHWWATRARLAVHAAQETPAIRNNEGLKVWAKKKKERKRKWKKTKENEKEWKKTNGNKKEEQEEQEQGEKNEEEVQEWKAKNEKQRMNRNETRIQAWTTPLANPQANPSPEIAYAAFVIGTSLSQIFGFTLPIEIEQEMRHLWSGRFKGALKRKREQVETFCSIRGSDQTEEEKKNGMEWGRNEMKKEKWEKKDVRGHEEKKKKKTWDEKR